MKARILARAAQVRVPNAPFARRLIADGSRVMLPSSCGGMRMPPVERQVPSHVLHACPATIRSCS